MKRPSLELIGARTGSQSAKLTIPVVTTLPTSKTTMRVRDRSSYRKLGRLILRLYKGMGHDKTQDFIDGLTQAIERSSGGRPPLGAPGGFGGENNLFLPYPTMHELNNRPSPIVPLSSFRRSSSTLPPIRSARRGIRTTPRRRVRPSSSRRRCRFCSPAYGRPSIRRRIARAAFRATGGHGHGYGRWHGHGDGDGDGRACTAERHARPWWLSASFFPWPWPWTWRPTWSQWTSAATTAAVWRRYESVRAAAAVELDARGAGSGDDDQSGAGGCSGAAVDCLGEPCIICKWVGFCGNGNMKQGPFSESNLPLLVIERMNA